MWCFSAGFVTTMEIEQRINLKFTVELKKKFDGNEEAVEVLEDTHFTENERSESE
jgi:hypothetical protein